MNDKRTFLLSWSICGIIILISLFGIGREVLIGSAGGGALRFFNLFVSGIIPIVFTLVGALIISRQPRNVIGWLVMTPAIVLAVGNAFNNLIQNSVVPQATPSIFLVFIIWFVGAEWVGFIFPLFFIALLFPTGSPPSPRWRWVVGYGIALVSFFLLVSFFVQTITLDLETYGVNWTIRNPFGFIPNSVIDAIFSAGWWSLALVLLTLLSAASLIVRYRRAATVEREQIKWILFACVLFSLIYVPSVIAQGDQQGILSVLLSILLFVGILGIPIAIGIAVLRYRLFDIDVIIRRTLIYAGLTITLGLVYFGGVVLLQELSQVLTGQHQSPIATVLSTLLIAALFTPLRKRIQRDIDRRFYRSKYDAQKMLERFAASARDEVALEKLTADLVSVVQETMQPESVSLWLRASRKQ